MLSTRFALVSLDHSEAIGLVGPEIWHLHFGGVIKRVDTVVEFAIWIFDASAIDRATRLNGFDHPKVRPTTFSASQISLWTSLNES